MFLVDKNWSTYLPENRSSYLAKNPSHIKVRFKKFFVLGSHKSHFKVYWINLKNDALRTKRHFSISYQSEPLDKAVHWCDFNCFAPELFTFMHSVWNDVADLSSSTRAGLGMQHQLLSLQRGKTEIYSAWALGLNHRLIQWHRVL